MKQSEQLRLAADLLEDGGEWEFLTREQSPRWAVADKGNSIIIAIGQGHEIRRKAFVLGDSINGFTLGEGQKWMVGDWERHELTPGERPLIKGEKPVKGIDSCRTSSGGLWEVVNMVADWREHRIVESGCKIKTLRPLPPVVPADPYAELKAAHARGEVIQWYQGADRWIDLANDPIWLHPVKDYRVKPTAVPLDRNDWIKGGPWFICKTPGTRLVPIRGVSDERVEFEQFQMPHEDIMPYERTNDGEKFSPCSKPAP